VVDHWEALNSDRPYRKAIPRDQVLDYIRENSGVIYDPVIADTFLTLICNQEENTQQLAESLDRD
jgi:HD-GYP domain-containing protein (c-di-GMP phosphodiesterase class II)